MTDLAQIALAFCHEVLGWEDAYHSGDGYIVSPSHGERGVWTPGNSADLSLITAEVHKWCKAHYCNWAVHGNDRHGEFEYLAYILPTDDYWEARCKNAPNPHYALMSACAAAARKLKGAIASIAPHVSTVISLDEDIGDKSWIRTRLEAAQIDPDSPYTVTHETNGDVRVTQVKAWDWLQGSA